MSQEKNSIPIQNYLPCATPLIGINKYLQHPHLTLTQVEIQSTCLLPSLTYHQGKEEDEKLTLDHLSCQEMGNMYPVDVFDEIKTSLPNLSSPGEGGN